VGIGDRASGQQFCDYTQLPADWLFVDPGRELLYEHRDRGILGFAADMSRPLSFLFNLA
jgi:hypothetical protein